MIYQIAVVIAGMGYWFCCMPCIMNSMLTSYLPSGSPLDHEAAAIFSRMFLPMSVMLVSWSIATIYGLIGAVRCFQGKRFRYPLIGSRLE
jgi:hypothetical protein